jgi:hypothetical protein
VLVIRARTNARERAQFTPAQEAIQRLDVAAEPMVVRDHDFPSRQFRFFQDHLHTASRERERPLAQHVNAGGQRFQRIRLVQVGRRADDDRIEFAGVEQVLEIDVNIRNLEAVGE